MGKPVKQSIPNVSPREAAAEVGQKGGEPFLRSEPPGREEQQPLELSDGWNSFFADHADPQHAEMAKRLGTELEAWILPRFIATQRWYAAKGSPIKHCTFKDWVLWGRSPWLLAIVQVETASEIGSYFLPLVLIWGEGRDEQIGAATLAPVSRGSQQGVLADAFADEAFCRAVVEAIGSGSVIACAHGKLRFTPTTAYAGLAGKDVAALPMGRPQLQGSNTVVTLGERLFLKGYRQVRAGVNPELELGRFLTETAHFANCVPVAGAVEYLADDGTPTSLALLQGHVANQGDGWAYTIDYLEQYFQNYFARSDEPVNVHQEYLSLVHTLGKRTAEMHKAFALRSGDPAFDPEPLANGDLAAWKKRVQDDALVTLTLLERQLRELPAQALANAQTLLEHRRRLAERIEACGMPESPCLKIRYHGDYHLGQVLVSDDDFIIIDFEGEPARPLEERRMKHSPLRDVAGMLRSFDYAKWSALLGDRYSDADRDRLMSPAEGWARQVRQRFLRAYDETARNSGLYGAFSEVRGVIELFELEKALYELRYEIGNRPGWIKVPLQGVLALCGL